MESKGGRKEGTKERVSWRVRETHIYSGHYHAHMYMYMYMNNHVHSTLQTTENREERLHAINKIIFTTTSVA